jgi:hypothetical protein
MGESAGGGSVLSHVRRRRGYVPTLYVLVWRVIVFFSFTSWPHHPFFPNLPIKRFTMLQAVANGGKTSPSLFKNAIAMSPYEGQQWTYDSEPVQVSFLNVALRETLSLTSVLPVDVVSGPGHMRRFERHCAVSYRARCQRNSRAIRSNHGRTTDRVGAPWLLTVGAAHRPRKYLFLQ